MDLVQYAELRSTFDDGTLSTAAGSTDAREYNRLLHELEHSPEAMAWRAARAKQRNGGDMAAELRHVRSLLRAREAKSVDAITHARPTFEAGLHQAAALEYRVHWSPAARLPAEWVPAARLSELLTSSSEGERQRLEEARAAAARQPVARCFAEYLERTAQRALVATALAQPIEAGTAAARVELLRLYEDYARRAA